MLNVLSAFFAVLSSVFCNHVALQVEILALRHQIGVLQRSARKRPKLSAADRFLWAWLSGVWSDWRSVLVIVKPETVIGWHRQGFRLFWTWKIRGGRTGRPAVPLDVRDVIRRMSRENPTWGAPRIHGANCSSWASRLARSVSVSTCSGAGSRESWRVFLENHFKSLVSVDFFTVPTIRFQVLYVFLVLAHDRRRIPHFNVSAHPTAEWTAQQLVQAFPWDSAPRCLLAIEMGSSVETLCNK
jgi:putative transposase